jgi:hypothetical protein
MEVVRDVLDDLVDEVVHRNPRALHKKTDATVKVTKTADNLYHAVATMRAMRGRTNLSRKDLRDLATFTLRKHAKPKDQWWPWQKEQMTPSAELRQVLKTLFATTDNGIMPRFVAELTADRARDEDGRVPPPTSLRGHGMPRAMSRIQELRRRQRLPDLRFQPDRAKYLAEDKWTAWRKRRRELADRERALWEGYGEVLDEEEELASPEGKEFGGRSNEFHAWFCEQAASEQSFATFYELEALAWALPERVPIVVYHRRGGKVQPPIVLGPVLHREADREPYELMWCGDDAMLFLPIVPRSALDAFQAIADGLCEHGDWTDDAFRTMGVSRDVFRMGGPELPVRLGIAAPDAASMAAQLNFEGFDDWMLEDGRAVLDAKLKRRRAEKESKTVTVKMLIKEDTQSFAAPVAIRHRVERAPDAVDVGDAVRAGRALDEYGRLSDWCDLGGF